MKKKFDIIMKTALKRGVVIRALKVALVVGILLNLINQGELLWTLDFSEINYDKLFLTFLAPYAVSVYTAVSVKLVAGENRG